MKLYSRTQLFRCVIICVTAAVLLTVAVCVNISKKKAAAKAVEISEVSEASEASNPDGKTEVKTISSAIEDSVAFLEQNPASVISVASGSGVNGAAGYTQEEAQNINVYALCNEAVVNINTQVTAYDWFLQPYVQDGGSGSGSIIDKRGYILTNVHVIEGASKIYVSLFDGTQYEAEVVGTDLDSDLAVIKFTPPSGME